MKNKQSSQSIIIMAEGEEAAKNMHSIGACPYNGAIFRNYWIIGWRNGGGDIMRGTVVTKIQRLIERKECLENELKKINHDIFLESTGEKSVQPSAENGAKNA